MSQQLNASGEGSVTPNLQNFKSQFFDKDNNVVGSLSSTLDLPFINQPKIKAYMAKNPERTQAYEDQAKTQERGSHLKQQSESTKIDEKFTDNSSSMHLKSRSSAHFVQSQREDMTNDLDDKYARYQYGSQNQTYISSFSKNFPSNFEDSRQLAQKQQKGISQQIDEKFKSNKSYQKFEEQFMKKFKVNPNEIYQGKSKKTRETVDQMSLEQLKKEAKNLYTVLNNNNNDRLIEHKNKRAKSTSQTGDLKKGFKIKSKNSDQEYQRMASQDNYQNSIRTENHKYNNDENENVSFIDQIRKKFNEHKFMKREDVLKLLKEIQHQETEKIKQKVFDQQEIFKGFGFNNDGRLFNQTQQNFFQGFKRDRSLNGKKSAHNIPDDLSHLFSVSRMGQYDKIISSMLNTSKNFNSSIHHRNDDLSTQKSQNKRSSESRNQGLKQIKETTNESKTSSFSPLKITKQYQQNQQIEDTELFIKTKEISTRKNDIIDSEKDDYTDMMKIGFRSLKKFENKKAMTTKRSKSQMSQVVTGISVLNPLINPVQYSETQVFKEVVRGGKLKQTKEMNKLQQELYEVYMKERLSTAAGQPTQNQTNNKTIFKDEKSLSAKPVTAVQKARSDKKYSSVYNKMSMNDDSSKDIKKLNSFIVLDGCHQNQHTNMPPTKIKINIQPYTHLEQTDINKTIKKINQFILSVVKQRIKLSDHQLIQLFKYFGISPPKVNGILDQSQFKQKDFLNSANGKLLQRFYKVLNEENGNIQPVIGKSNLSYYVGKGNNFYLVRQIVKRRVWWTRATKEDFSQTYNYNDDQVQLQGCSFIWTQWKKPKHLEYLKKHNPNDQVKLYNRLDDNYHLSNKKALFKNIAQYYLSQNIDPFEVAIPLTFHIKSMSSSDQDYQKFLQSYNQLKSNSDSQNVWILKPGENTNRGCGIQVSNSLQEIQQIMKEDLSKKNQRTYIVQKYIEKPLLINGRKFDIRCYALMTSINGYQKGYFYRDCYFRTSCKEFNINNLQSKYIHLTNDAIQKYSDDYGKYENGNKLSINDFQRYLDQNFQHLNINFMRDLFSQIERLVTDTFRAVYNKIDPHRVKNSFELYGYDFMIDENFKIYLIEANTNPCLEISCPLLARIIPEVVDNTFRLALDPLFQPGQFDTEFLEQHKASKDPKVQQKKRSRRMDLLPQIKFTLVYDEKIDGEQLRKQSAHSKSTFDDKAEFEIVKEEEILQEEMSIEEDDEGSEVDEISDEEEEPDDQ